MLCNMQVYLALGRTILLILTSIVYGRLSTTKALECLPEELWESSDGQAVQMNLVVLHCYKISTLVRKFCNAHEEQKFVPINCVSVLGLHPMVKLGSDTTLSAPHFSESFSASILAPGSHTSTHNNRNGTQRFDKTPSFY